METETTVKITEAQAIKAAKRYAENALLKKQMEQEQKQKLLEVNMKYQPKIEGTEKKLLESFETLTAYAKQEEKTLFASSKTASVGICKIQRRVSEKVVLLPDYDEDKVLAAVKMHAPEFVNTKETIDKTALKKAAEKEEIDLASVGLKIQENLTTTVKVS